MYEYKILTADSLEQAEQVMNDMAQVGWRVVGTTRWNPFFGHIPVRHHLERVKE